MPLGTGDPCYEVAIFGDSCQVLKSEQVFWILNQNRENVPDLGGKLERYSESETKFGTSFFISHIQIIDWGKVGFTFQLGKTELVSSGDLTTGVEKFFHHISLERVQDCLLVVQATQLLTELIYPLVHHLIVIHSLCPSVAFPDVPSA